MIDIKAFIKEALDNITKVKNLIVTYKVVPDVVTIALPSNYSESDMQIYLDDKCLDDFPGSNDKSKEVLGNNIDEINDAYFEYKKFEASDKPSDKVTLEWDPKYDANNTLDTFTYYTLHDLKYILDFSEFNLKNVDNVEEELRKIFETFNSGETTNYPLQIELEDIQYDE